MPPPQANDAFYNDLINQYAAMFTGRPDPRMFTGRTDPRGALFSGRPDPRMFSGPPQHVFTGPEPPNFAASFPFSLSNFPIRA